MTMKEERDNIEVILKNTLSTIPAPELKAGFVERVMERIRKEEKAPFSSKWKVLIQVTVYWVAVLILSLCLLFGIEMNELYLIIVFLITPCLFLGYGFFSRVLKFRRLF